MVLHARERERASEREPIENLRGAQGVARNIYEARH